MNGRALLAMVILGGLLCGCAWMEEHAPWLGVKDASKQRDAPITDPKHTAVLRQQDGMILPGQPRPESQPAPRVSSGQATQPVVQPTTEPVVQPGEDLEPPKRAAATTLPVEELQPVILPAAPKTPDDDITLEPVKIETIEIEPTTQPATEPVTRPATGETEPTSRPVLPEDDPLLSPATQPGKVLSKEVVAASMVQVNDRFVTIEDVMKALGPALSRLPKTTSETSFRRRAARLIDEEVRRQVTQQLIVAEARRQLTDPQKDHIDRELDETLREMVTNVGGGSRKKLERHLIDQGTRLQQVLADQRKQLTIRLYLRTRFAPTITVTRKMLWDQYQADRTKFVTPRKVQMQVIAAPFRTMLPKDRTRPTELELKASRVSAKKLIDRAVAELVEGYDFTDVARRLSRGIRARQGGLWDVMPRGSFKQKRVEEIAFKLKEGQMAGPIETPDGYYVVKAARVVPGKVIPFEEAQEQIDAQLREQQYQKMTDTYLRKLLSEATIIQRPQFLKMAVDRAVREYHAKD